jgi:hypothetical protein
MLVARLPGMVFAFFKGNALLSSYDETGSHRSQANPVAII